MRLVIMDQPNTRLDAFDLMAIPREAAREFARANAVLFQEQDDGAAILWGFDVTLGASDRQVYVSRGAAISGYGSTWWGQLVSEGDDRNIVSLANKEPGKTYGIWVCFDYVKGASQQRAFWNVQKRREQQRMQYTREVPVWRAAASGPNSPPPDGSSYFKVAEVFWDGSITPENITDHRTLFFEGTPTAGGNPATHFELPDFDRGDNRAEVGPRSLGQWARAIAKRLEEISGRAWYAKPTNGESLRANATTITIAADPDRAGEVHVVLPANLRERTSALSARLTSPGLGGDHRDELRFPPPRAPDRELVEVDTSVQPIIAGGPSWRRYVTGAATWRRVLGDLPLLTTVGANTVFRGLRFDATFGDQAVVQILNPTGEIVFEACEFSSAGLLVDLIEVLEAGTVRFVNCTFEAEPTRACVRVDAAAVVELVGCTFSAGNYGVRATVAPTRLRAVGCRFSTNHGVHSTTRNAVTVESCGFDGAGTPITMGPLVITDNVAANGLAIGGDLVAEALAARGGRLRLGNGAGLFHGGDVVQVDDGDGALYDAAMRRVYAAELVMDGAGPWDPEAPRFGRPDGEDRVVLRSGAGDSAGGELQVQALRLGDDTGNWRSLFLAGAFPVFWGRIMVNQAWNGDTAQDRRLNPNDGFFESFIHRCDGGGAFGDPAGPIQVQSLMTDDSIGQADHHRFRVTNLNLASLNYIVQARVATTDVPEFDGAGDATRRYSVDVYAKTNGRFDLMPAKNGQGVGSADLSGDEVYVIEFSVFARG